MATVTQQLGRAAAYDLLAAAGITNTGSSIIAGGNVGSFPTATYTLDGMIFIPPAALDSADAQNAQIDNNAAFLFFQALPQTMALSTADIGATGIQHSPGAPNGTYYPGVYVSPSSIAISTPVTLDAQGNPNAVFVFYSTGSTITQAIAGTINLVNGAKAANVVWLVGSSWTSIGPGALTQGNIIAATSITLGGGVLNGRALAGAVNSSGAITIAAAESITAPASVGTPTTAGGQAQALIATQPGVSVPTAYPQVTGQGIIPPQDLDMLQIIGEGGDILVSVDYLGTVHNVTTSQSSTSPLTSVAISSFPITSVTSAGVYTGTFPAGTNTVAGQTAVISGFTNGGNNGTFTITASTATTITVTPNTQVNESASAQALITGFSQSTYNGTITNGAASGLAGRFVSVTGFTNSGNNISNTLVISSTATTIVTSYTAQVAETHAATATVSASFTPSNGCRLGQYFTRLLPGATIAQLFTDAFANPSLLDIVHVYVPNSGAIVYILDHNGVASGS
jgi:hypothetical protein